MGFNYGGGEKNEALFNQERANKWTDVTAPTTGSTIHLSGVSPQTAGPLSGTADGSTLYVIVSKNATHILSTSGALNSASVGNQYWPADTPLYHLPQSGSTEYLSFFNNDGSVVEAWISIAERKEGDI